MFIIDEAIESRTVVDLGHIPHNAEDEVLDKEVSMFLYGLAMLDPFHSLPQSIFVQTKDIDLALNDAAKQTCSKELGINCGWCVAFFETEWPRMENAFRMLG